MDWWNRTKSRWEQIQKEYGRTALGTYLFLWASVLIGYAVAINMGIEVDGAAGTSGVLFGAWVAAKVSQPARIVLTIVLTPVVARVLRSRPMAVEE